MSGGDISMAMAGKLKDWGLGWRPTRRYIIVGERRQRQSQHYKGFDETAQVVQLVRGPRGHHTYLVSFHLHNLLWFRSRYNECDAEDSCSKSP